MCKQCEEGPESVRKWQQERISAVGWYAHMIEDPHSDLSTECHTHHLPESFGHPDIQIKFPLSAEVGNGILSTIVNRIKSGEKFEVGKRYDKILRGYEIKFTDAIESNRPVLRLILPDEDGNLDRDLLYGVFREQYEDGDVVDHPAPKKMIKIDTL